MFQNERTLSSRPSRLCIAEGKNKMPGYDKKLTEAEIKDVVAYLRGLCKK
jgi:mono/diheme cytochrome c family protein